MTDPLAIRKRILVLFGAGDFAFNLYWQAISLYLLFFYIDVLRLPPAVAGTVFMIGTIWDGAADFCAGAVAERSRLTYRRLIGTGALPLGLAFVVMFAVPAGAALPALLTQIVFRTLYAFTNIPYAAWTVRLATTGRDRSLVAGLRMGFGAAAAILVALAMPALVRDAGDYAVAAAGLAAIGVPLLLLMVRYVPEPVRAPRPGGAPALGPGLALLLRNRAFVALNLAAAAGGAATALASQSVLYVFRYVLRDEPGGPRVLAAMALVSLIALPAWTLVAAVRGARLVWLAAGVLALAIVGAMALLPVHDSVVTAAFLLAMQIAFAGFGLAAWTLLPETIDWGEARTGERVEALAFGTFALVQKVALAGAGLTIGLAYQATGFVAGAVQGPTSIAAIRAMMLAGPACLVAAMLAAVVALPRRAAAPGVRRA